MMTSNPNSDALYQALLARDPTLEGEVWVGVKTTGIFCRLTCAARKPKQENCEFFHSMRLCIEAGYRPCKRCTPLDPEGKQHPVIQQLLSALQADPIKRWSEADVSASGIDPSTARRVFKRHIGVSFLELARLTRLRAASRALRDGDPIIAAQLDAGFESASGFRAAFARFLGVPPSGLRKHAPLKADWIDTPLGTMVVVADAQRVHLLEFHDRKALATELKRLHQSSPAGIGFGRMPPVDQLANELSAFFSGRDARLSTPGISVRPVRPWRRAVQPLPRAAGLSRQRAVWAMARMLALRNC